MGILAGKLKETKDELEPRFTSEGKKDSVNKVQKAQRASGALVAGSLKANAGHTEPGAGLAGAFPLCPQRGYPGGGACAVARAVAASPGAQGSNLSARFSHVDGVEISADG